VLLIYKLSTPKNAQKEQYDSAWRSVYINSSLQNISYETWEGFVILCGIQPYFNSGAMILIFRKCYFGQYTILTASVTE